MSNTNNTPEKKVKAEKNDDMVQAIGANLKRIRATRKLSLEEVSNMSSVSKSMLSEIERGTKSPTISVLYRICKGIHISIRDLLKISTPDIEIVRGTECKKVGVMDFYVLYEDDVENPMEIQKVRMAPHTSHPADSHGEGVWECVMVMDGEFTLILGKESYSIKKVESLRFRANCHHTYANESDEDVWFYNITSYGT